MLSQRLSSFTLFRLSGVALLIGGLIATITMAVHPERMDDPLSAPVHLALYFAVMLILLGLPALIARQAQDGGIVGLIGGVLLFFGLAFEDPMHSVLAFTVVPVISGNGATQSLLDKQPPVLGILQFGALVPIVIGIGLLVATTLRSHALARWPAIVWLLALLALVGSFVLPPLRALGPALLYLGVACYGVALISEHNSAQLRQRENAAQDTFGERRVAEQVR